MYVCMYIYLATSVNKYYPFSNGNLHMYDLCSYYKLAG